MKNKIIGIIVLALVSFGVYNGLESSIPAAQPLLAQAKVHSHKKETVHYVALGDSLTEGIGDETNQGGFVNLISKDLQHQYHLSGIETDNYGVAGERSDQIRKRLENDSDLQKSIESADLITLTVGGNDIMKVIRSNIFGLTVKSFKKPMKKYDKELTKLFSEIRELNPTAPIYIAGVYNPFYLSFPEIKDMQKIIDQWNKTTKNFVDTQNNTYYIPINDLLYKGLDGEEAIGTSAEQAKEVSDSSDLDIVTNDALSEDDNFHPNHLGYQLMANALKEKIVDTQEEWLHKE